MANLHAAAASAVTVTNATETVVATVGPFNTNTVAGAGGLGGTGAGVIPGGSATYSQAGPQGVVLGGSLEITTGTGTTALVLKVRQGTGTSGTQVGQSVTFDGVTAGKKYILPITQLDTSPVSPATYVVTVTQTGGSATGTVDSVVFWAEDATSYE